MSATGRGAKRRERDFYPTPAWCTRAILPKLVGLHGASVLEPCKGDGAIMRELEKYTDNIDWAEIALGRDFFKWTFDRRYDFVVTNPPYSLAMEFISRSLSLSDCVVMLLPLSFLASTKRRNWWMTHGLTALWVLSKRPSFTGDGKTDATDYAWFVWDQAGRQKSGIFWL